jgi:phage baseplate assembly protein gpV
MRQQAQMVGNDQSLPRVGTISSYDQTTHAVKVLIQPEGVESNWMPLGAIGIGNGWGIAVGPQIGDQVLVVFEHGDFESGVIVARLFSVDQAAPPVPSGEIWAVHQSGSFLKFHNDGKVELNTASDLTATVGGNLTATVHGNVECDAQGSITHKGGGQGSAGGVVQKDCLCAFTGMPHVMISSTVKASK